MRQLLTIAAVLMMVCLSVSAYEWQEIGGTYALVSDHDTGRPALIFNTGIRYDEVPARMQLRITWEVFSIDGGVETMLYEYTKTTSVREGTQRIWSASQSVLIEPGTEYGARVWIDDLENGLSYVRTQTYLAPYSVPVALRLIGSDGSEEADLSGLSDQELNDLVALQRTLSTAEILEENVDLSELFSQHTPTSNAYPVAVVLLPETGIDSNWGTEAEPITATFGLAVYAYSVRSAQAVDGFGAQVAQYEQSFTGTIYAGSPSDGFGQGATLFVHDGIYLILRAATQELETRSH